MYQAASMVCEIALPCCSSGAPHPLPRQPRLLGATGHAIVVIFCQRVEVETPLQLHQPQEKNRLQTRIQSQIYIPGQLKVAKLIAKAR